MRGSYKLTSCGRHGPQVSDVSGFGLLTSTEAGWWPVLSMLHIISFAVCQLSFKNNGVYCAAQRPSGVCNRTIAGLCQLDGLHAATNLSKYSCFMPHVD